MPDSTVVRSIPNGAAECRPLDLSALRQAALRLLRVCFRPESNRLPLKPAISK